MEELFRRYSSSVFRRARAILGDGEAAQDATQEVFLRAMNARSELAKVSSPIAWLYRVTTNLCITRIRETERRRLLLRQSQPSTVAAPEPQVDVVLTLHAVLREVPDELQGDRRLLLRRPHEPGRDRRAGRPAAPDRQLPASAVSRADARPDRPGGARIVNAFDLPPRPDDCLSDLALDRLLARELDGRPEKETGLAHLATCARCQQRRAQLEAEPLQVPGEALLREIARRRASRRRAPVLAAISLLAAAAVVLLVRPRPDVAPQAPVDTRLKGGALGFEILVRRKEGGRVGSMQPDVPLHPGDVIGFRVRSRSGGHLAIVSIDGAGGVSSYLPGPAGPMPLLPAGEQMVEGGVALDAIAGRETLVAVLCADEAEAVRALAAARAALAKAGTAGLMPRLELPCDEGRAVLVKEAPP